MLDISPVIQICNQTPQMQAPIAPNPEYQTLLNDLFKHAPKISDPKIEYCTDDAKLIQEVLEAFKRGRRYFTPEKPPCCLGEVLLSLNLRLQNALGTPRVTVQYMHTSYEEKESFCVFPLVPETPVFR